MRIALSTTKERLDTFCLLFPEHTFELIQDGNNGNDPDAVFILDQQFALIKNFISIPVFVHDVLKKIKSTQNIYRINLWPGFEANEGWEICGTLNSNAEEIITKMNRKIISSPDIPGMISARVIAMIINEAFFAIEDNVSTAAEINTAMKLGTNYPYGPLEWAEKIGHKEIHELLEVLTENNPKYKPAAMLVEKTTMS